MALLDDEHPRVKVVDGISDVTFDVQNSRNCKLHVGLTNTV